MLSKKKAPRLFEEDSSSSEDDHGDQVPKTKPNSNKVKKMQSYMLLSNFFMAY